MLQLNLFSYLASVEDFIVIRGEKSYSKVSPDPKEQHLEETLLYQDIGLEGREDIPQPGVPLRIILNGRFVLSRVSAELASGRKQLSKAYP